MQLFRAFCNSCAKDHARLSYLEGFHDFPRQRERRSVSYWHPHRRVPPPARRRIPSKMQRRKWKRCRSCRVRFRKIFGIVWIEGIFVVWMYLYQVKGTVYIYIIYIYDIYDIYNICMKSWTSGPLASACQQGPRWSQGDLGGQWCHSLERETIWRKTTGFIRC